MPQDQLGRATASPSSATRCATAGGRITPDAVSALVDAVGDDLRQLSAAASQLVSDFGGTIDADAVARFHHGQAEVTGFTVAERVLVGDRAGSIEMLRWALERGVAHVLIADAIADGVRTAARVASLNTTNPGELARDAEAAAVEGEEGPGAVARAGASTACSRRSGWPPSSTPT